MLTGLATDLPSINVLNHFLKKISGIIEAIRKINNCRFRDILKIKHNNANIHAPIPKNIVINPGIPNSIRIKIKPMTNQIKAGESQLTDDSIT
jgi:hypothetical protein